jgi:hypothetical protein
MSSIVDDLIENLVERNAIDVTGTFKIGVVDGGLSVTGTINSTVRDTKRGKPILKVTAPVDARVTVGEVVIPLPQIK